MKNFILLQIKLFKNKQSNLSLEQIKSLAKLYLTKDEYKKYLEGLEWTV